jgi:hypothetical protein
MNGRHVLILMLAMFAFAGARHVAAQQPDPFERAKCQDDFVSMRGEVEKHGKALQDAGKRKATAPEVCGRLKNFTGAEARMIKYMQDRQQACGFPDELINRAKDGHVKAVEMRTKVCQVAANPQQAPAPVPSQGLSGALGGSNIGGPPSGPAGGSGVFDTLTGNVLRQ